MSCKNHLVVLHFYFPSDLIVIKMVSPFQCSYLHINFSLSFLLVFYTPHMFFVPLLSSYGLSISNYSILYPLLSLILSHSNFTGVKICILKLFWIYIIPISIWCKNLLMIYLHLYCFLSLCYYCHEFYFYTLYKWTKIIFFHYFCLNSPLFLKEALK